MSTLIIAVLLLLLGIPLVLAAWYGRLLWKQGRAARAEAQRRDSELS